MARIVYGLIVFLECIAKCTNPTVGVYKQHTHNTEDDHALSSI